MHGLTAARSGERPAPHRDSHWITTAPDMAMAGEGGPGRGGQKKSQQGWGRGQIKREKGMDLMVAVCRPELPSWVHADLLQGLAGAGLSCLTGPTGTYFR